MAGRVPNSVRDELLSLFRERICERMGVVPLIHQRRWWCAADGLILIEQEDPDGLPVKLADGSKVSWATMPRPYGRSRVLADLGAFKSGKSFGTGMWAAGFGAIPDARVTLVGLEYSIAEPEFNYICDFLLSEAGMGLKFKSYINRPRQGDMFLELANGARFEAKSWERKDALKGKECDAYIFCEAYQLPGMECFTDVRQNLVARDGYAIFPTTPDRPWIKELHDKGHGDPAFPEWECVCGIPRKQNPFTFNAAQELQDRSLLTKEKFEIAHHGELGDFVGRVFNYKRGENQFNAETHPDLFPTEECTQHALVVPTGWEIVGGADTGTHYSAVLVAFSPSGDAFVLEEFPNYRYLAGTPERDESISIPQWARRVSHRCMQLGGRPNFWADPNTQFKGELRNYNITLLAARVPVETRTEVTREYFEHKRVWLAPWLNVLPWELENAAWPAEASASGKFQRIKDRDHTLDGLEHILARRPYGRRPITDIQLGSYAASAGWKTKRTGGNVHLGVH